MAEPRRSHQALADGRVHLANAVRLLADLPTGNDTTGREGVAHALATATDSCAELIRLLTMEERLGLTAIRGNAQLALRRLEMGGILADPAALRTALRAILAAADRLIRQVEALEAVAADDPESMQS
jgi:nitrogen-specific signal transduction histidine kinase